MAGERVDLFSARDQNGGMQTLKSIIGPKGGVRPLTGGPFCKIRPTELEENLEARGLGFASRVGRRDSNRRDSFLRLRLASRLSAANGPAEPITRAERQAKYSRLTSQPGGLNYAPPIATTRPE